MSTEPEFEPPPNAVTHPSTVGPVWWEMPPAEPTPRALLPIGVLPPRFNRFGEMIEE